MSSERIRDAALHEAAPDPLVVSERDRADEPRRAWIEAVARIRESSKNGEYLTSPHLGQLYDLALADGPKLLGSFRRRLGEDRILDLIHDLMAARLERIIEADEPRALFSVALHRRAISWLRRGDADVVADPEEELAASGEPEDERRGFVLDARAALENLKPRERAIVIAVALGESREAIAEELGTTRANVDQIVSRVRRLLAERRRNREFSEGGEDV